MSLRLGYEYGIEGNNKKRNSTRQMYHLPWKLSAAQPQKEFKMTRITKVILTALILSLVLINMAGTGWAVVKDLTDRKGILSHMWNEGCRRANQLPAVLALSDITGDLRKVAYGTKIMLPEPCSVDLGPKVRALAAQIVRTDYAPEGPIMRLRAAYFQAFAMKKQEELENVRNELKLRMESEPESAAAITTPPDARVNVNRGLEANLKMSFKKKLKEVKRGYRAETKILPKEGREERIMMSFRSWGPIFLVLVLTAFPAFFVGSGLKERRVKQEYPVFERVKSIRQLGRWFNFFYYADEPDPGGEEAFARFLCMEPGCHERNIKEDNLARHIQKTHMNPAGRKTEPFRLRRSSRFVSQ